MPAKSKKKTIKKTKRIEAVPVETPHASSQNDASVTKSHTGKNRTPVIIAALTVLLLLGLAFSKGYVLVAIVNNKPVFRFQLNQTLMSRYGKQTLESMISTQLIEDEAKKANVSISQTDIDKQEQEVLKSFGGKVSLEELLNYQGMTKAEFDNQIKLQLMVNKLLEKGVTISDEEVATFMETNKSVLVSSDEASLKQEAKKALMEQKINEKLQSWFTEIKNKAKIFKFI